MAGSEPPSSPGERCALCEQWSTGSMLTFAHTRGGERATLAITVCEACGTRLEKHLKRALPKRLFDFRAAGAEAEG